MLLCQCQFQQYENNNKVQSINTDITSNMNNCIQKFTNAPIQYINQLRSLKTGSITMKGTSLYPAFPLALLSSLLSILGLSVYLIFYFFTVDTSTCYEHITYGIIVLAIIYPIEAIIVYVCMFGSVALATTHCWKIFSMIFFGLIVTGFSFGGLGFAFLCTISQVHPLLIPSTFLSSNTFIQIIVYGYLSFFALYILLVPVLTISYNQRAKDPNPESSCCDTFCCVIYYICQFLFMLTALFMICIKILGPALLIYVLVEVARAGFRSYVSNLTPFFALSVLSIFLPLTVFIVVYLIANYACKSGENSQNGQTDRTNDTKQNHHQMDTKQSQVDNRKSMVGTSVPKRKSVFLTTQESKTFGQEPDSTGIGNDML